MCVNFSEVSSSFFLRGRPLLSIALNLPSLSILLAQLLVLQLPVLHHALPVAIVLCEAVSAPARQGNICELVGNPIKYDNS